MTGQSSPIMTGQSSPIMTKIVDQIMAMVFVIAVLDTAMFAYQTRLAIYKWQ